MAVTIDLGTLHENRYHMGEFRQLLDKELGREYPRITNKYNYYGDGWSLISDTGRWLLNIDDDTLAVAFKLQWL